MSASGRALNILQARARDFMEARNIQSEPKRYFDNPPLNDVLCAEDIRAARLDRDGFGRIHPEIAHAVALQVLKSIATEQIGASSSVKALAAETLEKIA